MRLLYASPERLANTATTEWLARSGVSLLAIDEAHCVSQWGHDFRPEYALLGEVRRRLGGVQTIALTATADVATRGDILRPAVRARAAHLHPRLRPAEPAPRHAGEGPDQAPAPRLPRQAPARERHRLLLVARRDREAGRIAVRRPAINALPYHAGMSQADRATQPGYLPAGGRDRDGGDGRVRHGDRQAGRALRRPRGAAEIHRSLLPGDRPRRPRRRAGRHADPLRSRRHAPAPLADRGQRRIRRAEAGRAPAPQRPRGALRGAALPAPDAARLFRRDHRSPAAIAISASTASMSFDGTVDAQKLLSAIARTGERFGTEHLDQRARRARRPTRSAGSGTTRSRPSGSARTVRRTSGARSCARSMRCGPRQRSRSRNTAAGPSPSAAIAVLRGAGADRAALGRADEAARAPAAARGHRGRMRSCRATIRC